MCVTYLIGVKLAMQGRAHVWLRCIALIRDSIRLRMHSHDRTYLVNHGSFCPLQRFATSRGRQKLAHLGSILVDQHMQVSGQYTLPR